MDTKSLTFKPKKDTEPDMVFALKGRLPKLIKQSNISHKENRKQTKQKEQMAQKAFKTIGYQSPFI